MRRRAALLLAVLTLLAVAVPAHADAEDVLVLMTSEAPALLPGESAWIHVLWSARGDEVTDVEVRGKANRGAEVEHPSARGWSSFPDGRSLTPGRTDFTALKITMPTDVSRTVRLRLDVTFLVDGERERGQYRVDVPVADASGEPYLRTTDAVAVGAGQPEWVHVFFKGIRPTGDFSVVVDGTTPFDVHHPTGRSDSSLQNDQLLEPGEGDFIGLLVDPGELAPGTYDLPLRVTTSHGVQTHTVSLRVDG